MKVLVTGGAGMVGSHTAEHFARDKRNKVVVYDNLMRSRIFASKKKSVEYNWHYLHQYKNIDFWKNDVRDTAALERCFRRYKPDVVLHAAAQPGVRFSLDDPREDHSINCGGTVHVLEAFRRHSPRGTFLFCSTNKVYGEHVNALPLVKKASRYCFRTVRGVAETMDMDLTGHTPYGVSKLAADMYVQDFAHTYGLRTAVFRMSCIYGTRQFGFEDQGWIAWFTLCHLRGGTVSVYGDGRQVRDVLWVEDLVQAYDAFLRSPLRHGVFNIGGGPGNTLSLRELLALLSDITGKKSRVVYRDWRAADQKVYISDIGKVSRALGWKPRVGPRDGVDRLLAWLKEHRASIGGKV